MFWKKYSFRAMPHGHGLDKSGSSVGLFPTWHAAHSFTYVVSNTRCGAFRALSIFLPSTSVYVGITPSFAYSILPSTDSDMYIPAADTILIGDPRQDVLVRRQDATPADCDSQCNDYDEDLAACYHDASCECGSIISSDFMSCLTCSQTSNSTQSDLDSLQEGWDEYSQSCAAAGYPITTLSVTGAQASLPSDPVSSNDTLESTTSDLPPGFTSTTSDTSVATSTFEQGGDTITPVALESTTASGSRSSMTVVAATPGLVVSNTPTTTTALPSPTSKNDQPVTIPVIAGVLGGLAALFLGLLLWRLGCSRRGATRKPSVEIDGTSVQDSVQGHNRREPSRRDSLATLVQDSPSGHEQKNLPFSSDTERPDAPQLSPHNRLTYRGQVAATAHQHNSHAPAPASVTSRTAELGATAPPSKADGLFGSDNSEVQQPATAPMTEIDPPSPNNVESERMAVRVASIN